MRLPKSLICQAMSLGFLVVAVSVASADTVGYWRMETDSDPTGGYSVPDELLGNPLTGSSGSISDVSVPANPVPATGAANTGALDGGVDVNGTIGSYSALNTESITVEFWARSLENDGGLLVRSTGSDGIENIGDAPTGNTGTDGLAILDPNAIDVRYFVDDGTGGSTEVSFANVAACGGDWKHFAFTYDKASGVGSFFVDGRENAAIDGEDDRALVWGAETTDILVGIGLDGGSAPAGGTMDEIRISDTALSAADFLNAEQFTGIAKDSFLTTTYGTADTYTHGVRLYNDASNSAATAGTIGFSAEKAWGGGDTSNILLLVSNAPDDQGLTHNLLSGELDGAAQLKAKDPRTIDRQLDTTIPEASTYYMSALLHATETEEINLMSVGFSSSSRDRTDGMHIGFNGDNLAVFAGGNTYDLLPGSYEEDMTYLVLVELAVDASGNETLSAYYSLDGESGFRIGLADQSVETFTSVADLEYLQFLIDGNEYGVENRYYWMDEVRLATTIEDLGIDFSVVPEPSTLVLTLLGLVGLVLYGWRRQR